MVERFGDYNVYEQIGTGGMASVHLAESRQDGSRVALKRLLPHHADDPEAMRAFLDEARLVRHLHHPNIATTYDSGNVGGTYFIAMEYVPGHTLAQLIRRCADTIGIIPFPISVKILIQLCDALDYAHNLPDRSGKPLGIIHRDISPANVILSSKGVVKLIDFGIAKAASQTQHSQAGVVKGKFSYMAPEYLKGKLDYRVDIWALGVVAHELLTHRPLFKGQNDFETLFKVRADDIQPPSRHNPDVPPDLDAIVMTSLQREPDLRWQSAGAMRTALANAATELQTVVSNAQLTEWVEWMFTQEPLHEGSELSQLIKLLEMPRSTVSKVIIVDDSAFVESNTPAPSATRAPSAASMTSAPSAPSAPGTPSTTRAPSAPSATSAPGATRPTRPTRAPSAPRGLDAPPHDGPRLPPFVPGAAPRHPAIEIPTRPTKRKRRALRVFLLFCLLLGAGAYATWYYGYVPVELTELLGLPAR